MNQMEGSRNRYVAIAVAAILLGILTYHVIHSFYVWELRYQTECVNRDLLNWDGNLRFTSVLEFNRDIRDGNIAAPLVELLKSPTWPPLRKAISLVLSFFSPEPSPMVDTQISTVFSLLLLIALPACGWIILRKEEGLWAGAVAGLIVLTMAEFPLYSFAAMLETQGMLFFLLASTAYYLNRDAGFASGRGRSHIRWILFMGFFGLYMTKYPYGILLILSVVLIEAISYTKRLVQFVKESVWPHYWVRWNIIFPVLVAAAVFVFVFRTKLGLPPEGKVYKQAVYATLLLAFIDLNIHWFRNKVSVRKVLLAHQVRLYAWGILPIAIWFLSSPDRFGAFLGAGMHVQEQGRIFAWSLMVDTLELPVLMPLVMALLAAGMIVISRGQRNLRTWVRDPMNAAVLVILGNLLLLEVLTANKQFRHIYHLVPALVLFSFLVLFKRYRPGHSRPGIVSARGAVGEAAGLLACVLIGGLFVFFPDSMGASPSRDYICFAGKDPEPAEPARRVAAQIPEGSRIVVWNRFHELDSPAPGRLLASEMDLLIRYRTGARARNESRYSLEDWRGFDRFAYVSYDCKTETIDQVEKHVESERDVDLVSGSTYFDQSGICLQLFKIQGR
ncbi:MAG: hypothetical protein CMN77_14710 [Spirochaetaceae bacterium]|nr:hypothetical protein [Spirochaetaceae bacterium]|tara:strand:- start:126334 stop:128178 length:1845 start_codon:yes stop_codon:yes gene_type:complete